jgi:hypothetical protein
VRANLVGIAQARACARYGQVFEKRNRAVTEAVAGIAS